jgi:hypothetical protein
MLGYMSASKLPLLLSVAVALAACSQRTLVLVDLCFDGGAVCPKDGIDAESLTSLRRGLVGLWHFDERVGDTTALDSSGNGNHATLVGLDPTLAWVTGRLDGALNTGGIGYAQVPDSASIDGITDQVTLSAWVYFDGVILTADDYGTAISRQVGSTTLQYYHLSLHQGAHPTLFIGPTTSVPEASPTTTAVVAQKRWTHLAGTYNGSLATLYVDGVEFGSVAISGTFTIDTTPLILGGNGNTVGVTERFPGRIDEVSLYNRALSPDEIALLATAPVF